MTLKLEVGKHYRNANGEKVGPMEMWGNHSFHFDKSIGLFHLCGESFNGDDPDLISEWSDEPEARLLKDWNPQEGDVFKVAKYMEFPELVGNTYKCRKGIYGTTLYRVDSSRYMYGGSAFFELVSRANQTPRTFGELTDAEKGALLLAEHENKRIFTFSTGRWHYINDPMWIDDCAYQVEPTRIKGSIETDADGKPMFDTWEADQ